MITIAITITRFLDVIDYDYDTVDHLSNFRTGHCYILIELAYYKQEEPGG